MKLQAILRLKVFAVFSVEQTAHGAVYSSTCEKPWVASILCVLAGICRLFSEYRTGGA